MQPKTVGPQGGRSTTLYETRFDYKLESSVMDGRLAELQERYGIKL